MASLKVASSVREASRTPTAGGMRRIKSHEPGQRVMTEAIAFLFAFYGRGDAPMPEEFFALCRHLSTQSYQSMNASPRRKLSSRLIGSASSQFLSLYEFLEDIEPLTDNSLSSRLIQAQNIGLRALITYTAFVEDDTEKTAKTHIIEPYIWLSNILFHDSLDYRGRCMGAALQYINDGVLAVLKYDGKRRVSAYFDCYDCYKKDNSDVFLILKKYLDFMLTK